KPPLESGQILGGLTRMKQYTYKTRRLILMKKRFSTSLPACVLMTLAVAGISSAIVLAQGPPPGAGAQGRGGRGGPGQTVEKIRMLKPNLYMITGGGANTLVRVTTDGLIVVDTKNPGDENYMRVMEEIRSVSQAPVKYVINTHHHPDHVGNNQKF